MTAPKVKSSKRKPGTKTVSKITQKETVFLTEAEVMGFSLKGEEQKTVKAEIEAKELVIKNYQLEIEVSRLKSLLEGSALAALRNKLAASRKLSIEYQEEIKKKYDITAKSFGYNPDTGQLIEE